MAAAGDFWMQRFWSTSCTTPYIVPLPVEGVLPCWRWSWRLAGASAVRWRFLGIRRPTPPRFPSSFTRGLAATGPGEHRSVSAKSGCPRFARNGGRIRRAAGSGPTRAGTGSRPSRSATSSTTMAAGRMTPTMAGCGCPAMSGRRPGWCGARAATMSAGRRHRQRWWMSLSRTRGGVSYRSRRSAPSTSCG